MAARRRRRGETATTDDVELANLPERTASEFIPTPVYAAPTVTEERRERELEEILGEIGNDARIRVYQFSDGKTSYAGEVSAEGFSLETLLDTFGGGEKTLVIMQGKTPREKVKVWLDPSVPAKNPRIPKTTTTAATSPGIGDVTSLIAAMAGQSMSMIQMMQGMASSSQQSTAAMIQAMATMMTANNSGKADPMALAVEIAKVMKGGNDNGGGAVEMFKAFREGLDLGERVGSGKDDDDDGVMGVVKEGMSMLGTIVGGIVEDKRAKEAQARLSRGEMIAGPVQVVTEDSAGEVVGTIQPTNAETETVLRPWVKKALPFMGQLVQAASFLTPAAAADSLAEKLSDDEFNDLLDDIHDQQGGGFGVRLPAYFPGVRFDVIDPHWLGRIIEILISEYVEETADETTTNGKPD